MAYQRFRRTISEAFGKPLQTGDYGICDGCGYPIPTKSALCPYCGTQKNPQSSQEKFFPWGRPEASSILNKRYNWVRPLNVGGMGRVDLAIDKSLGSFVAVKSPLVTGTKEDSIRIEKLKFEASVLKMLHHNNVVKHVDSFEEDGVFYLVLDYVPGLPLSIVRARQKPKQEQIINWCQGISLALDYLHSNAIVYRDLKPSNIIIGPHDTSILIDFGAVQFLTQQTVLRTTASIFTPIYAAPEMMNENIADVRSDIYSFGCVLYYMVTGEEPPRPRVDHTLNLPMIEELFYGKVNNAITAACHWTPSNRPQSIKEFWNILFPTLEMETPYEQPAWVPQSVGEVKFTPCISFVMVEGMPMQTEMQLPYGNTLFGRSYLAGEIEPVDYYIPVQDKYVSLQPKSEALPPGHARIIVPQTSGNNIPICTIEDLESTNGTFVNGDRISSPTTIYDGDRISLGPYTLFEFHLRHS